MWTRFKDSSWTKKGKWSTGSLGNGMRAFTVVSHLLPNACGGQVGTESSSTLTYVSHNICYREFPKIHDIKNLADISVLRFLPRQAPCPQTMSCTTASPGLPLNWTNSVLSWKTFFPVQIPDSGLIKGALGATSVVSTIIWFNVVFTESWYVGHTGTWRRGAWRWRPQRSSV